MPADSTWLSTFPGMQSIMSHGKNFLGNILRTGPVPRHIAFVMDGNRRYATQRKLEVGEGHNAGFESLSHILELCYEVGVECVTVYAFSIENFKRPPGEVKSLMNIAKNRLTQLCNQGDLAEQYGIKICVLGDLSLLPDDVRQVANKTIETTKNNKRAVLNICFPYTSRDDITRSIRRIVSLAAKHKIDDISTDINESLIEANMYTKDSPPLDILIRTSNVTRLSDFMLWQCHKDTSIYFVDCLWPNFGVHRMFWILLKWGLNNINKNRYGPATNISSVKQFLPPSYDLTNEDKEKADN
ncbi:Di-trans-poly-cis-decaprenylcistransferase [Nadsonia fulvescens var. elongata DSM 6958]|uniref:Alkyl transferase n=1 Tax=Nadsonia fulvescens var. elongata DSM 6958 TaxID=857566 RepID=A0A1E3PPH5_9ASCO|nr:Di-trans-poly-cis-decaprenylcistransferase [Nadsonia fulvescens var. elongata DSM 6958]